MGFEEQVQFLKRRSIEVILDGQHDSGAYIAAPSFAPYAYSWFRDGSFIADAMSRVGEAESAEAFFDWGGRIVVSRKEAVEKGEILHTRYTAEGEESAEEWPNFQLDGFGTYVWALYQHAERHGQSLTGYQDAIDTIVYYLGIQWRAYSYDWWEEYAAIHPSTLAPIYAAFRLVGHPEAEEVKRMTQNPTTIDASLLACATPFEAIAHDEFTSVLQQIESALVSAKGGVHRHERDVYYGGGEWALLTAFLGWHYARLGEREKALQKLARVVSMMDQEGNLPEQTNETLLFPQEYDYWVRKWGSPAQPLLWSHAMFLTLANELGV